MRGWNLCARSLLCLLALVVVAAAGTPVPPVARPVPHVLTAHGQARLDEYYWLRERDDPAVLAYLAAENAYLDTVMAPATALRDTLYAEIVGRLVQDDASVPEFSRGYFYSTRFVEGGEYALHCRRRGSLEAPEEIMLDGNALAAAAGTEYFALRGVTVSSDNRTVAYATDTVGRRKYTWRFRDLATGLDRPEAIADMTPNGVWAEDGRTFFYTRQDPETLRSFQVWRHELGSGPASDVLVYEEADETFDLQVAMTKSRRYLLIQASRTLADEVRFLAADDPAGEWRVFQPRERGLEYSVDHLDGRFIVRTNLDAVNFRLVECGESATGRSQWRDLVPHRADVLVEDFEIFAGALVVAERRDGLTRLHVKPWRGPGERDLDFDEPTYSARIVASPELATTTLRFGYSSLTTPDSIYDYDLRTGTKTLRKQDRVVGAFDPAWYRAEYVHATAPDGAQVPVSLVYRLDRFSRGRNPCLLYGYGSYGYSQDAEFESWRLSLLDRGFVFAIAHVRGGSELGRAWYEDGKLMRKRNTFSDFVACGEHLVAAGYADPARLFAMGGSAGGLLMGAVVNLAPDLWNGVVAQVPFVDVVTTMLDASIPLTTSEYDEWGDPNEKTCFDYMLSYSPYDQVERKAYPNLLVLTGWHDSQVQYWEPAKWVARLRARKTDDHLLLLHTNLEAGHGGASGRFRRHQETALECAFLLRLARAAAD
ncbi:MAG TPA: S9 family peptidase [Candidatus Krumholzibacteria bacterium]|nr:S9 family peptidase [Candidatus Krumholzibacteria bacterium]HPD70554.1 S9 family peptidase [Candidatus Krumholzibacteria bacterium]HRY39746.1 S9 family peptidase [Candidatus Krumholzibacteria bacterium]